METPFEFITNPQYYPLSEPLKRDENELSFDADVDPTEYECNTCGWRGQTPARTSYPMHGTEERRYCPVCRKWTETPEEWNMVPADPFEFPMLVTATSVSDLQSAPVRKAAAQQLALFEGVA